MRSFIAIPLDNQIKSHLLQVQKSLQKAGLKASWARPDNLHLTIHFLGDIDIFQLDAIKKSLPEALANHQQFTLGIKNVGAFPSMKKARVIWAGLKGSPKKLQHLVTTVRKTLYQKAGIKEPKQPFHPHLTLGRLRQPLDLHQIQSIQDLKMPEKKMAVFKVMLYESRLTPQGAIHTPQLSIQLKG